MHLGVTPLLYQGVSGSFLDWLPGESIFSLVSRHHRLWGHASSDQTTRLWFGRPRSGVHHDFPSALDEFAKNTAESFASADALARERTLLRFYRPFLSSSDVDEAVQAMRGSSVAHLKFGLGLLTSRFRANHPLKACRSCMREDRERHGWVYWHLTHQFPGVWVCPQHGDLFASATVKATGVERFQWCLPDEDRLLDPIAAPGPSQLAALRHLALITIGLVERDEPDGWLHADLVQQTLRYRLHARGWVTAAGNVRLAAAAPDYMAHCAPLRAVPELGALPETADDAATQLGRLLRPLRSGTHPLRLLVAIAWLFQNPHDFVQAHEEAQRLAGSVDSQSKAPPESNRPVDPRRDEVVELARRGHSARSAAAAVGVDIVTAKTWAAQAGVQLPSRPSVVRAELRDALISDLREGADKSATATRYGISTSTVTRILRTEVGLWSAWRLARHEKARTDARRAWSEAVAQQPELGTRLLRELLPAQYAWLYRNDRAWLVASLPPHRLPAEPRRSPVDWDARDEALSQTVRTVAAELATARPGKRLRLWQIYQLAPELKAKLGALARLPRTRKAIEVVLSASAANPRQLRLEMP